MNRSSDRPCFRLLWLAALGMLGSLMTICPSAVARAGLVQRDTAAIAPSQENSDVTVTGHRLKNGFPSALSLNPEMARGRTRHQKRAEVFAKCMRFFDPFYLRGAIDGVIHSSTETFALGRLIQKNIGCYPDQEVVPPRSAADLGDCNAATVFGMVDEAWSAKECRAPYDRAAILRRVMAKYGGTLELTAKQTRDPAVQARFNAREVPRNRLRRDDDKLMFEISVCLVRMAPELSVDLVEANDTKQQYWLEDDIIDNARPCIGGAQQLGIDPADLRDYISDSVYRWIVAARNVDSLIPADA
jgi:hypothetical protein